MTDEKAKPGDLGSGLLARFDHPVIGLFIGSWIVWNWQAIYWLLCGVRDPKGTILVVSDQYLKVERFHDLVTIPLFATLAYVLFGPLLIELNTLYKDFLKTAREYAQAIISKLKPVPKYSYDNLNSQLESLRKEQTILENFYRYSQNKTVKNLQNQDVDVKDILNIQMRFASESQIWQKKIADLEAQLLMLKNETEAKEKNGPGL